MHRLFAYTLVRLVVLFVLVAGAYVISQNLAVAAGWSVPPHWRGLAVLLFRLAMTLVPVAVYLRAVRWIERRPVAELERRAAAALFLMGAVFGLMLFATVYFVFFLFGVAHLYGLGSVAGLLPGLTLSLTAAFAEELVFRGVLFRIVEQGFGTLAAVLVSAALFGGLHAWNPGATTLSTAAIALEAGILLGLAYSASRTLWLPIGIHFGWNLTEGSLFGAAVSGHGATGLLDIRLDGPDLVTGGAFGPEASIVAIVVCLTAAVAFGAATRRHGEWRGMRLALRLPAARLDPAVPSR